MNQTSLLLILGALFIFVMVALIGGGLWVQRRARSSGATKPVTLAQLAANPADAYARMVKQIRSWGFTLVGFGALSFVFGGFLSAPWGIVQIAAGLLSFYFVADAAMFAMYAGIMVWVALWNFLSGQVGWAVFGFFQLIIASTLFRLFKVYQRAYKDLKETAPDVVAGKPERAPIVFPWLALVLSLSGVLGFGCMVIFSGLLGRGGNTDTAPLIGFLGSAFLSIGELGTAFGAASLLAGFSKRAASITAVVVGVLIAIFRIWVKFQ